jgi:hypothetical protein
VRSLAGQKEKVTKYKGRDRRIMETDLSRAAWRKSTHSGGTENCVEVAGGLGGAVGVRDSKNPADPALIFTSHQWGAFTDEVKNGKFDR